MQPGARMLVTAAAGGVGSAGVRSRRRSAPRSSARSARGRSSTTCSPWAPCRPSRTTRSPALEPFDVILDQVGGESSRPGSTLLRPARCDRRRRVRRRRAGSLSTPPRLVGRNSSVCGFYLGRLMKLRPEVVRGERASCSSGGRRAGCRRPSARSSRWPRRTRRCGRSPSAVRRGRSCSCHDGADADSGDRDGWCFGDRCGPRLPVAGGGPRGRGTRPRHRLRRLRSRGMGGRRRRRRRVPERRRARRPARPGGARRSTATAARSASTSTASSSACAGSRGSCPRADASSVTASLAGLTAAPDDPVYAPTKHAVVGFVRSAAPRARRTRSLDQRGLPRLRGHADGRGGSARPAHRAPGSRCSTQPSVAEAAWVALQSGETGHAWVVQPGRPPIDFRFPTVPGPRTAAESGSACRRRCPRDGGGA